MKSSAVLCLVLLTVIFASSVKFSAGFPSAAAEKISDDLKTFEGRRSVSRGSRPNFLVYLSRFFLEHLLTSFTCKIMLRIQSRFKGGLILCTFTSQGIENRSCSMKTLSLPLFFTRIKMQFF